MKPIVETDVFTLEVPLLETDDLVRGELDGPSNAQALALAHRTHFLNERRKEAEIVVQTLSQTVSGLDADDVNAEPAGASQLAVDNHVNRSDPHTQYLTAERSKLILVEKASANQPNGYLQLDASGKLPAEVVNGLYTRYIVVGNEADRLALAQINDLTIVAQNDNNRLYYLNGGLPPSDPDNWIPGQSVTVNGVVSIFGRTGVIDAQNGDYTADQINETLTRLFVSPTEKQTWNQKQDLLVSGVTLKTFKGVSLLGSGNIDVTPAGIGAAAEGHTHTSSQVTDFSPAVGTLLGTKVKAGANVQVVYDDVDHSITLNAIAGTPEGTDYGFVDRLNSSANQNHLIEVERLAAYASQAYALKMEKGLTNQVYQIDTFDAGSSALYQQTGALVFNGKMSPYFRETLSTSANGNYFYSPNVRSDGISLTLNNIPNEGVVPTLISGNDQGFVVSESSAYNGAYAGWKAFSGNPLDPSTRWSTSAGPVQWLQVKFPNNTLVDGYVMQVRPDIINGGVPTSWTVSGSNDGTNWTPLDTQTNVPAWVDSEKRAYKFPSIQSYQYYRITVTAVNSNPSLVTISLFNLTLPASKFVIAGGDGHNYTAVNGVLSQLDDTLDSIDFNANGFTSSGAILAAQLTGKTPIKVVSKSNLKVVVESQSKSQIAKTINLLNGYQWAKINSANVITTQTNNGKVRIAVTRDNTTFFVWSGSDWVSIGALDISDASATKLINQGMTPGTLNLVSVSQWAQLFVDNAGEPDTLAFAYVLSKPAAGDVAEVDSLTLNVDNYGQWKLQTPAEVEIRYAPNTILFKTMAVGDYRFLYRL